MTNIKNILHLLTNDYGGVSVPVKQIHSTMLDTGLKSQLLVLNKTSDYPGLVQLHLSFLKKLIFRVRNKMQFSLYKKTLHGNKYLFRIQANLYSITVDDILNSIHGNPDVLFIHWVDGFLNFKLINQLQERTKAGIVFFHHDMGLYTGGCHYSFGCEGYKNSCNNCPAIMDDTLKKQAETELKQRLRFIPKDFISVVGSTYLEDQLKSSTLYRGSRIERISSGINSTVFTIGDKIKVKQKYGIEPSKRVLFFGAESVNDNRKGFNYLLEAIHILQEEITEDQKDQFLFVIVGKNNLPQELSAKIPFNILCLDFTSSESTLVEYYQLSDVFICPTVDDGGPLMVFQSLMCGVPVIAFNVGIAADIVNEENGYIAPLKNVQELKRGIKHFIELTDDDLKKKQLKSRQVAMENILFETQNKKFLDLLERI